MELKIKVCGIKYQDNLDALSQLNIDMIGFNFYAQSSRYVIDPLVYSVHSNLTKVGVFVNEDLENIYKIIDLWNLDAVQLHGNESVLMVEALKKKSKVIKVFKVKDTIESKKLEPFAEADVFLFDTYTPLHGGSGKRFDWSLLERYQLEVPFILSGGISNEDVEDIKSIDHPLFMGVDINSKMEISAGLKDVGLINDFSKRLKSDYEI